MYLRAYRIGDILRLVCASLCLITAQMATAQEISPAETLLFMTNHFQSLHEPVALTYSYKKVSNIKDEPGFDDEVHVDVTKINTDGSAAVSIHFLSGSRKLEMPAGLNLQGNPVVQGFLDRDIAEMKRLTSGSTNYFRKRIRLAFAEAGHLNPVVFTYKGKQVAGQEVSVQPYLKDPMHERFEKYLNKSYVFVISNQIPGSVYQIRTSLSGGNSLPQDPMLMDETLTLTQEGSSKS